MMSEPKVRVISYTRSNEAVMTIDPEDIVSYTARVSNPSNQNNFETADKLLGYLVRNQHWSPLEMVNVVMEIETTRDIARQILRHRSFSFQEFSQRYADPTDPKSALGFVLREARLQDPKNRQNSLALNEVVPNREDLISNWEAHQSKVLAAAEDAYRWAIENGIAKEQARVVLPEGLTVSRLYMQGTLRSWIHYCVLRCANGTQKEHMDVAELCRQELFKIYPFVEKAWPDLEKPQN